MSQSQPVICDVVAGLFVRDGQLLLGYRINTEHHADTWGLPAGRSEPGEDAATAIVREMREELGIEYVAPLTPHIQCVGPTGRVYAAYVIERWSGNLHNAEPHLCRELTWHPLGALPEPVTPATEVILGTWQAQQAQQ